jgi:hypothetical protein
LACHANSLVGALAVELSPVLTGKLRTGWLFQILNALIACAVTAVS